MENQDNQAIVAKPAQTNAMDKRFEGIIDEIKAIEAELGPELEFLSQNIDATFSDITQKMNAIGDFLVTSGLFSEENNRKIELACEIGEKVSEIASAVTKSYQHNKQLDKLLVTKKKYAAAKQEAFLKLSVRLDKVHNAALEIFKKRMEEVYSVAELKDEEMRNMLVVNIVRETMILKTTGYHQKMLEYFLAEFGAWSEGRQYSDIPRPCYHDVNADLLHLLFSRKEAENILKKILIPYTAETVTAPQLLLLADDQLASYGLQYQSAPRINGAIQDVWTEDSDDLPDYDYVADIMDHEILLPMAQQMLNNNKAYTDMREKLQGIHEACDRKVHVWSTVFGVLMMGLNVYVFGEWLHWAKWLLGLSFLICTIIIIKWWRKMRRNEREEYESQIAEAFLDAGNTMLKNSGYEKHDVSHLQRKSLLKEGAKATFNAIFNS